MKPRRLRTEPPACTCGSADGVGHQATCAYALHTVAQWGARAARGTGGATDGLGRKSRHLTAKATEVRGIRLASRLEAAVYGLLLVAAARVPGAAVVRGVRFDLWRSWREGMGKPLCFTPDFLVVRPRAVRALEPVMIGRDTVLAEDGHGWAEGDLDLFDVEVHEAKTARGLESRDFVPRLAAFRAEHPTWPVFVWRRASRGQPPVSERLADLVVPAPPGGA